MARNGYDSQQPNTIWQQYLRTNLGPGPIPGSTPSPTAAQNQAQIAAAVTDTDCTLSADLGGIYFAIQTSYERQLATANQQGAGRRGPGVQGQLRQGAGQAPGPAANDLGHA